MVEISLEAKPLLGGVNLSLSNNTVVERGDLALVSIAVPLGGEKPLFAALKKVFSLQAPKPTLSTVAGDYRLLQSASDQFLLLFPHRAPDAENLVQGKLKGSGYTTDQTDAFVAIEVAGPDTLSALERLCPLDLAESTFPINSAARTVMEHLSAYIIRLESDRFLLLSASSSAASFLDAIETSYRNVLP